MGRFLVGNGGLKNRANLSFARIADLSAFTITRKRAASHYADLDALHLSTHTHLLHELVLRVDALQRHSLFMMGLVTLGYAGLLFVEGFGLWIETSWAAYLTVICTSILLPGEFHALFRELSLSGFAVLSVNVVIVAYLVRRLAEETLHSSTAQQ